MWIHNWFMKVEMKCIEITVSMHLLIMCVPMDQNVIWDSGGVVGFLFVTVDLHPINHFYCYMSVVMFGFPPSSALRYDIESMPINQTPIWRERLVIELILLACQEVDNRSNNIRKVSAMEHPLAGPVTCQSHEKTANQCVECETLLDISLHWMSGAAL
jgi:hypothetical protein